LKWERWHNIHIGRPIHYSGSDCTALHRMSTACDNSGMKDISFFYEPEAAAISYIQEHNLKGQETMMFFDFGGGTLDLSIIKSYEDKTFEVLGNNGLAQADDEINRIIYKNMILPMKGKGIVINDNDRTHIFPFDLYESHLLNWQSSYILNQPLYISKITDAIKKADKEDQIKLMNLKNVIKTTAALISFLP